MRIHSHFHISDDLLKNIKFPLVDYHDCDHRRTGQGAREAGAPHVLGSKRKFGQSQFSKTFPCFFHYFEDLNIKSVVIQLHLHERVVA